MMLGFCNITQSLIVLIVFMVMVSSNARLQRRPVISNSTSAVSNDKPRSTTDASANSIIKSRLSGMLEDQLNQMLMIVSTWINDFIKGFSQKDKTFNIPPTRNVTKTGEGRSAPKGVSVGGQKSGVRTTPKSKLLSSSPQTFCYFAFASNLLEERLRLKNPSAQFVTIGRLADHSIQFDYFSGRWHGAIASITKAPGKHVWGVIWRLDVGNIPDLDKQEGVSAGVYEPVEVDVQTKDGETMRCRSYNLLKRGYTDKRPSPQYLYVMLRGARQHNLPEYYIKRLKAVKHNDFRGKVEVMNEIFAKKV